MQFAPHLSKLKAIKLVSKYTVQQKNVKKRNYYKALTSIALQSCFKQELICQAQTNVTIKLAYSIKRLQKDN